MANIRDIMFACALATMAIGPKLHAYRIKDKEPGLIKTLRSPLNRLAVRLAQLPRPYKNDEQISKQQARNARDTNQLSHNEALNQEKKIGVSNLYPRRQTIRDFRSHTTRVWKSHPLAVHNTRLLRHARDPNQLTLIASHIGENLMGVRKSYPWVNPGLSRPVRDSDMLSSHRRDNNENMVGVGKSYYWVLPDMSRYTRDTNRARQIGENMIGDVKPYICHLLGMPSHDRDPDHLLPHASHIREVVEKLCAFDTPILERRASRSIYQSSYHSPDTGESMISVGRLYPWFATVGKPRV